MPARRRPDLPEVMGLATARRNQYLRELLQRRFGPDAVVVDVGSGLLDRGHLLPKGMHFRTDIRQIPGLSFVSDGGRLPLRDRSVDVIVGLEILEHVACPDKLLNEAARVLRPHGMACFSVPATFPRHDTHDYWRFTQQGLQALANRSFPRTEVIAFGHTFETIAVLVTYYLFLIAQRVWPELRRVIPVLESLGYHLDRRLPWARSNDGLHTLNADLLLIAQPAS